MWRASGAVAVDNRGVRSPIASEMPAGGIAAGCLLPRGFGWFPGAAACSARMVGLAIKERIVNKWADDVEDFQTGGVYRGRRAVDFNPCRCWFMPRYYQAAEKRVVEGCRANFRAGKDKVKARFCDIVASFERIMCRRAPADRPIQFFSSLPSLASWREVLGSCLRSQEKSRGWPHPRHNSSPRRS